MQRTGEKVDRATDQDKLFGAGPLEQTGKNIDKTMRSLKPRRRRVPVSPRGVLRPDSLRRSDSCASLLSSPHFSH